ncbi:hypothetical protein [Streptomyces purpureus]|uniref:Uncharacterized protein n=1 Tax=Streptomyces purpureus TaxID=1951 RepID=A0A918GXX4_9ACTN|nr:hypothetical protein [Streptomyces purpureus]GGT16055.1 hypothetical protein GCM10014713_06190 [Streptomyces purpureus]
MVHPSGPPTTTTTIPSPVEPTGQPVVLVLDYPGHRPEEKLTGLRLEAAGFDVRYVLTRPLPRDLSADAYARRALQAAGELPHGVHAVLAYCMSASLAQHVAVLTSASHLLLLDAERSTPAVIAKELLSVLRSFTPGAELPAWWSEEAVSHRPEEVMERVEGHLHSVIAAALAEDDSGDDLPGAQPDPAVLQVARTMAGTYLDWLAHLMAAHRGALPAFAGRSAHLVSADHRLPGSWDGIATLDHHRVACARESLAVDEETRRITLELLGAQPHFSSPYGGNSYAESA